MADPSAVANLSRRRSPTVFCSTLLCLAVLCAALPPIPAHTQPRADRLDLPLAAANMCGAGDPRATHFTLAATGDTFPHENIQAVGEAQGYDTLFDHLRPFLRAADLGYTNFDGAMLAGSPLSGYPTFNYSPSLAPALRNAGIGLVSTANNHILDRGPEGLDATLRVLAEAGIAQHGAVASAEAAASRPPYLALTLERGAASLRVGFISATWGTNGIPDPAGQVNLLWESAEYGSQGNLRQSVLDAIAQARRETDLVVVAAHWGYEYQFYPDATQVEGARRMAEAGADIILGAQPHTLQPVDILTSSDGRRTLVAYSLANLLASQGAYQDALFTATSVVLYVGVARGPDGRAAVTGYRYLPTLVIDADTRPAPLPPGHEAVLAHVRAMMRDPGGLREVSSDPALLGERVEICPALALPGVAGPPVPGDFARFYATLGGDSGLPPEIALEALGAPLGPPVRELSGDCAQLVDVLYTENQRLELRPEAGWPYRVVGAQLGVLEMQRRYGDPVAERRAPDQADEPFRSYAAAHGGLPVFGHPLGGVRAEVDPVSGATREAQYFERARLERDDGGAVRPAPLGERYRGAPWCSAPSPQPAVPVAATAAPQPTLAVASPAPGTQPAATAPATPAPLPTLAQPEQLPHAPAPTRLPALQFAALLATLALTVYAGRQAWRGMRGPRPRRTRRTL